MNIGFRYSAPLGKFRLTVRSNASDAFIFGEVFDHLCYDFELPFTPETIIDAGANAGFTTLFFSKKYPFAEIASVEPMTDNVTMLRRNISQNGVRATIFPQALCVAEGPVRMKIGNVDYAHTVATGDGNPLDRTVEASGVTVGAVMQQLEWKRIDLMKIDIEGYERYLLTEGCEWLNLVNAICIECHGSYGEYDLRKLCIEFGFRELRQLAGIWLLSR